MDSGALTPLSALRRAADVVVGPLCVGPLISNDLCVRAICRSNGFSKYIILCLGMYYFTG
jgi:hypothetical protein